MQQLRQNILIGLRCCLAITVNYSIIISSIIGCGILNELSIEIIYSRDDQIRNISSIFTWETKSLCTSKQEWFGKMFCDDDDCAFN